MSGFVETLLSRYDAALAEHAEGALATPQGRDSFEYGRVSGIYTGLHRARDILKGLIDEADAADDRL